MTQRIDEGTAELNENTGGRDFRENLVALIPFLRAFARTLCGRAHEADDLCQEALTKAWQSRNSFEPGTNQKAWLFTILRRTSFAPGAKRTGVEQMGRLPVESS